MIYQIQGKQLEYVGGECGIYKAPSPMQRMEYAAMDMGDLVNTINGMPAEQAIQAVTQLKDLAAQQVGWQNTPQNLGYPILRQLPGPSIDIGEVRGNIQNTERFCNDVLAALQGK
jgi:hypothetical protein